MSKRFNKSQFVEEAIQIHGDRYNYSLVDYVNMNTKVIIKCSIHDEFEQLPAKHIKGQGCRKCWKGSTDKFVKLSSKIHNNFYDYSLVDYKGANIKVSIICPIHGQFWQAPSNHINRQCGCYKCGKFGLNKQAWIQHCKNTNNSYLYIIKCYDIKEEFIKIGITSKSVKNRYKSKLSLPYRYNVLKIIQDCPENIWNLEQTIKNRYIEYKYKPELKFGGDSECFKIELFNLLDL